MNLNALRRAVQLASLLLYLYLLALTAWPLRAPLAPELYLRADPLAALAIALSPQRSWALLERFWPALLVLLGAFFMGRVYCGWLCPLGTCVAGADRLLHRRKHAFARRRPNLAPFVLAASLGAALFGGHLFWLFDPIPLLTRSLATALHPAALWLYNLSLGHGDAALRAVGLSPEPLPPREFALGLWAGLFLLGLFSLGLWGKRYWCRSLCPLGALLGLASRLAPWRRRVAETCNTCGRCVRACPTAAIPLDAPRATSQADCLRCLQCLPLCPQASIRFATRGPQAPAPPTDSGRRHFLAVGGAGVAYGALARYGLRGRPDSERLLRPPGALVRGADGAVARLMTEAELRDTCLRCGECMKACPTGGLQPAVAQAGLDGFYTPVLVPRRGWCEERCNACGQVCPSGALVPFAVAEKPLIRIGLARIDHSRCLAWQQGSSYRECLVCHKHCPYDAIAVRQDGGQRRPVVRPQPCVGCGLCESVCPVTPQAAIIVSLRDQHGS